MPLDVETFSAVINRLLPGEHSAGGSVQVRKFSGEVIRDSSGDLELVAGMRLDF